LGIGVSAPAAVVTGTIKNRAGTAVKADLSFNALNRPLFGTNDVRVGWTVLTNSGTDGTFTINLLTGDYKVQVGKESADSFQISVPDTATTNDIASLTTNVTAYIYNVPPTNWIMQGAAALTSGKYGFAPTPTNGQQTYFLRADGAWAAAPGAGGGSTEYIAAGTNVTVVTNGSVFTISSTATGSSEYIAAGTNVTVVTNGSVFTISSTATGSAEKSDITNSLTVLSLLLADTNTFAGTLRTYAEQRTNNTKIARTDFPNYYTASNYWDGAATFAAFTEFLDRTEFGSSNYFGGVIRPAGGLWATNGWGAENQFLSTDGAGKVYWKTESTSGGGSWFEEDGNGDLMPALTASSDSKWETDTNGDLQPQ
jgi:hypothetical protein